MYEDDHEHDEECMVATAPMTGWDFLLAFFAFLAGVGKAFTDAMEFLTQSAAMANNHAAAQKDFADQARAEFEALPVTGDVDG